MSAIAVPKILAKGWTTVCLGKVSFRITALIYTTSLCSWLIASLRAAVPLSLASTLPSAGTQLIWFTSFIHLENVWHTCPWLLLSNWGGASSSLDPCAKSRWLFQLHWYAAECKPQKMTVSPNCTFVVKSNRFRFNGSVSFFIFSSRSKSNPTDQSSPAPQLPWKVHCSTVEFATRGRRWSSAQVHLRP